LRLSSSLRHLSSNARRSVRRAAGQQSRDAWLRIELSSDPSERPGTRRGEDLELLDLLRCLDAAATDPLLRGVCLVMRGRLESWSRALSLQRALWTLRDAGKPVAVWAESLSTQQFLVASAAERLWLPESGSLQLVGLRTERFFLRDLLQRLAIEPEVVHIGRFKSAGEVLTRDSMSPEQRDQIESWQGDLFDELVKGVARGRGLRESRGP